MINLHERMLPTLARVEHVTSWSPVRHASNWATEAGTAGLMANIADPNKCHILDQIWVYTVYESLCVWIIKVNVVSIGNPFSKAAQKNNRHWQTHRHPNLISRMWWWTILAHFSLETLRRVNGNQCRMQHQIRISTVWKQLNHFSLGISISHSWIYLNLKLDSPNI